MKIIFLDHQGVMYIKKHPHPGTLELFDVECISVLNSILETTGCEIVISSDWKYWVDITEMQKFYLSQGIVKTPLAYTEKRPGGDYAKERSIEINNYVESHPEISSWVSVDDLDMRSYLTNFIYVEKVLEGIKSVKDDILKFFN